MLKANIATHSFTAACAASHLSPCPPARQHASSQPLQPDTARTQEGRRFWEDRLLYLLQMVMLVYHNAIIITIDENWLQWLVIKHHRGENRTVMSMIATGGFV